MIAKAPPSIIHHFSSIEDPGEHSMILWELLKQNSDCIKGIIETSNRQTFENSKREEKTSIAGRALSNYEWLPNRNGMFHEPSKLLLTDLPDDFETASVAAREVAEKLGMKKPEVEKALEVITGGDKDLERLIESYKTASEADKQKMLKTISQEIPPQPAPSFKEGLGNLSRPQRGKSTTNDDNVNYPINYPYRYQEKLNQQTAEKVTQHQTTPQTVHFTPVRESPSNKQARVFLYEQYQGRCQITGDTFFKASANANGEAENYFEACALLSYSSANYLNDAGNMLCVSADTMAKLKHASFSGLDNDNLEPIIEKFKNRQSVEMDRVSIKIQLAGEECEITWSERHFARLVALWERA